MYTSQYAPHRGGSTQNVNSYGMLGSNLGAWYLRSDYQHNQNFVDGHLVNRDSESVRTHLLRPIPSWSSKLTMGQYDLSSNFYDTFHFTGVSLESGENMPPLDLQGYVPQTTDVARTNAEVTVVQNDRVLYQTIVAPGPFTIPDLGQSFQGQLDATVEEEDGCTSTSQVGSASTPYLTRKGQVRYRTSLGKPASVGHNDISNPSFWMAEALQGRSNNVSLYGGGMFTANDYQAITTDTGFNLNQFGSFSFDIIGTDASLQQQNSGNPCGYSYRFNYARHFEPTGNQITFAGYRFSDKDYVSVSEYLSSRNGDESIDNGKESCVISSNQYFETPELNSYPNVTCDTYWDSASNTNYFVSISKNFDIGDLRGIPASLAVS